MLYILLIILVFFYLYKNTELFDSEPFETFVINLQIRNDRKIDMINKLKQVGIEPIFVNGINGKLLNRDDLIKKKILFESTEIRKMYRGELGCFLSHVEAWKQIAESDKEYGLIMEDDVTIAKDFKKKCIEYIAKLPKDWDLFYVGRNCYRFFEELCYKGKSYDDNMFIPDYIGYGTYSYFMTKKCAKRLLKVVFPFSVPVDVYLHDMHQLGKVKTYTLQRAIAYVKNHKDSDSSKIR
jgi:glycosyl transferase family 25